MLPKNYSDNRNRFLGLVKLFLASAALFCMWTVALPKIRSVPPIARQIQAWKEQGIDPSAMVYTDQPSHLTWETNLKRKLGQR